MQLRGNCVAVVTKENEKKNSTYARNNVFVVLMTIMLMASVTLVFSIDVSEVFVVIDYDVGRGGAVKEEC